MMSEGGNGGKNLEDEFTLLTSLKGIHHVFLETCYVENGISLFSSTYHISLILASLL